MRVGLTNDGDGMINFEIIKKAGKLELPKLDILCEMSCVKRFVKSKSVVWLI